MPARFSLDDLVRILSASAGGAAALDGDIADVLFVDLGYDSLALMECASRIAREYGIEFADDAFAEVETPADLVGVVNDHLQPSNAV
jgi:minimal PKS acyl carrier protein